MNNFLKKIVSLSVELNEAEGFHAMTVVRDIELLYDNHIADIKRKPASCIQKFTQEEINARTVRNWDRFDGDKFG